MECFNKSNQEVALLKDVEKGYFDRWKDKQINTEKITDTIDVLPVDQSSPWVTQPIDYLDGVLKNHCLRVFLKGKGIEEVNLGERKGRIVLEADLYTVEWPDLAEQLPGIFKLNVKADGQSYEIDGWYHWYEELMRNQARVRESVYERLESDPNLETYENVVDLFNDLMERLILDEKDLDNAKEQGVTKESRMHDQSELRDSESIEISDNIDDYCVKISYSNAPKDLKIEVVKIFMELAYIDGVYDKNEENIIVKIVHHLDIDFSIYQNIKESFEPSKNNQSTSSSTNLSLKECYEVLESNESDSIDTIKKNYRRLVKQYHYDSMAAKNLPPDMLKFAEDKTKTLNQAYEKIKKSRG